MAYCGGESGCGKTSLLRAGLTPKLRNEKFIPLYIKRPTKDPQEAIRTALFEEISGLEKRGEKNLKQLLKSAAPKGKKFVVLFDQFEEFFLTNRTPTSRAGFVKWLGEAVQDQSLPVIFLIGIRADFFAQLQNFAPQVPEPTSARSTYQLQNFEIEQAKQIFNAAAKADGIPFEAALIQAVVKELETEEFVRPAELQVVGTRLKRKNVFTLIRYEALGGAQGILSSYISEEIKQSANEHTAKLVLRLMCAESVDARSPIDLGVKDILNGVIGVGESNQSQVNVGSSEIESILNQFVAARVVIRNEENKYNLAHDYLAPYVHTATQGIESNTERANRYLNRYISEFREDTKARIPANRLLDIRRYASPEAKNRTIAKQLIQRSMPDFYIATVVHVLSRGLRLLFFVILISVISLYPILFSSYYFSIEKSDVVIRSGNPKLIILPGFDEVVIETGFREEDLEPMFREAIIKGEATGFWFNRTEDGYQIWGEQLSMGLMPLIQANILRQLGQVDRAAITLSSIILDTQTEPETRLQAIYAFGVLAQENSNIITTDLISSIVELALDPRISPYVRSQEIYALGAFAQVEPNIVTPYLHALLSEVVLNPRESSDVRAQAIFAVASLAQAKLDSISPEVLTSFINLIIDPITDPAVRAQAASALRSLVQAKPDSVRSTMLMSLSRVVINNKNDPFQRTQAIYALESLVEIKPNAVNPSILASLYEIILNSESDINLRAQAALSLGSFAQANPNIITSDTLFAFHEIIMDPQTDSEFRFQMAHAYGTLVQINPDALDSDMLVAFQETILNRQSDSDLRTQIAYALGLFANAKSYIITTDMLNALNEIIIDSKVHTNARFRAAYALRLLAEAKPEAVSFDMLVLFTDTFINTSIDTDVRSKSAYVLRALAQVKPGAVTTEMISSVNEIVLDPNADSVVHTQAAYTIGSLAQANPNAIPPDLVTLLTEIILNPQAHFQVRFQAAYVVGSIAQSQQYVFPTDILRALINLLNSDTDRNSQIVSLYALYGISLADEDLKNLIQAELEDMQLSPKPNIRIAAYKLSEMLSIGKLIYEAQSYPDRVERIKLRLHYLGSPNNSIDEVHIRLATSIVLDKLTTFEAAHK